MNAKGSMVNMCRTCMKLLPKTKRKIDKTQSIREVPTGCQNNTSIAELLQIVHHQVKVDIKDGLPTQMCSDCVQKLMVSYEFIEMYKKVDKQLRKILKQTNNINCNYDFNELEENFDIIEKDYIVEEPKYGFEIEHINIESLTKEEGNSNDVSDSEDEPMREFSEDIENTYSDDNDNEWKPDRNRVLQNIYTEESEEVNEILPTINNKFRGDESLQSAASTCESKGIYGIMTKILNRMNKIEQNQSTIINNQSISNNVQSALLETQKRIGAKMKKIEETILSKSKKLTQNKLVMDEKMDEVAKMLPLQSTAAVRELEEKLNKSDFSQAMMTYLYKIKGVREDVSNVIRAIFTDQLLQKYNWDGRLQKHALAKLTLFNKTLRNVFQQLDPYEYEKNVRKAVERSHHRFNQSTFIKKQKSL